MNELDSEYEEIGTKTPENAIDNDFIDDDGHNKAEVDGSDDDKNPEDDDELEKAHDENVKDLEDSDSESQVQHNESQKPSASVSQQKEVGKSNKILNELNTNQSELKKLNERAEGINRETGKNNPSFVGSGVKMCPTRHGCKGATNCDYEYASYPL